MSRPLKGALFVEGDAEEAAAPILLEGLWNHLQLPGPIQWQVLSRRNSFKNDDVLLRELERFYRRLAKDFSFLIVMFDADEKREGETMCPGKKAPLSANVLRAKNLPIPAAVVLPCKEYEHWFVACLPQWAGREIVDVPSGQVIGRFLPDTSRAHDYLDRRNGKRIIDQHLAVGHYGERTHQPVLTAMLDFAYLCHEDRRAVADAVGFGPLHRACHFLADSLGQSGAVYPPAKSVF